MWNLGSYFREEQKLQAIENKVLRRIFEPKTGKLNEFSLLHEEELRNLCRSPNIVERVESRRLLSMWLD
jgi:hypothetical protein